MAAFTAVCSLGLVHTARRRAFASKIIRVFGKSDSITVSTLCGSAELIG